MYCPLLGLPSFAVHTLYKRQHATSYSEQDRTSRLQHAAWGRLLSCSSPSPAVPLYILYISLARIFAPSQSYYCIYIYIYIILKLQLSWHFPLPGRRNFVLVHPCVHPSSSPLAAWPWDPNSRDNSLKYAHPLCVPTLCQLKYTHTHSVCPLKYSHAHSACPLRANCTPTLCAHSSIRTPTLCATQEGILKFSVCPLKYTHTHSVCPLCANSSIGTPTLCAHSRRHSHNCRGIAT